MKQYTTPEQTAKLIELGFEKPKNERWVLDVANESTPSIQNIVKRQDYSIGELIEILPEFSSIYDLTNLHTMKRCWYVGHVSTLNVGADELIDALYNMIVKLKEAEIDKNVWETAPRGINELFDLSPVYDNVVCSK